MSGPLPVPQADPLMMALRVLYYALDDLRNRLADDLALGIKDVVTLTQLLDVGGSARPSQLSDGLQWRSGTLTAILDHLESAGLVKREPNPDDRRSVLVVLQPAAHAQLIATYERVSAAVHACVPEGASDDFIAAVERLAAALGKISSK